MGRSTFILPLALALALTIPTGTARADDEPPPEEGTPPTTVAEPEPEPEPDPAPEPEPDPGATAEPKPKGPKPTFVPVKRYNVLKKLVFPVVGRTYYHSGFGACRDNCTREHHGIDIMSYDWKGLPVVAAHDGVITKVTYDDGNPGCSVRIRGRDRWETRYYHLSNDVPGTDELGAPCPAPGIEVGTQVVAGQIIGYLGDSGNAETTPAHLHFELRNRSGYPIDPYRSLRKAEKIQFEWISEDPQAATIAISQDTYPKGSHTLIVVPADEIASMVPEDDGVLQLEAPVLAMDPADPAPTIAEIERLSPERVIAMSDVATDWIEQAIRGAAPIVDTASLPKAQVAPDLLEPDVVEDASFEYDTPDRFLTIIEGVVDRIYRSRKPAFEEFVENHRSMVLTTERWAPRGVGQHVIVTPGKYRDRDLLWWLTSDGWIGTEPGDPAPAPGIAYVTERRVTVGTMNFLGSLAELDPYPMWRR